MRSTATSTSGRRTGVDEGGAAQPAHNGGRRRCERLGEALLLSRQLARLDPALQGLADRIESALIELGDLADEFEGAARDADFDEEQARAIRERMELWLQLKRKYGPDVRAVLARRDNPLKRLANQGDIEGRLLRLEQQAAKLRPTWSSAPRALREGRVARRAGAGSPGHRPARTVGLQTRRCCGFEVVREPELHRETRQQWLPLPLRPPAAAPSPCRSQDPLVRRTRARVMLALKTVLASADETPVLVFDEVDAKRWRRRSPSRSARGWRAWARATRSSASPTCPGSPPRRPPITSSRRCKAPNAAT
jgi:DNA repair protein RecN (Recombination protein N)